jgi:hypothetical protein
VTLEEFIAEDEPGGEALLGTADQAVIPEGGDVMVYGDGGAGKTTLVNDGLCHLASGDEWLGIPVAKKVRILVVENEGPRQLFRRKLRRKAEGWTGSPLEGRITIFQKPWARLSIGVKEHREWLAGYVRDHQIDLIVFGPLTASGMDEAGTLQDTRAFAALLDEIRAAAGRTITFVVIHHENKGGKVSGAWEGVGDTLIHVRSLGPGKTQVFFQKARWSSEWHRKKLDLDWADAEAFTITETPELTDEDVAEQIVAYVSEHPDTGWGKVEEAVKGVQDQRRRNIRDGLLAKGKLVNRTKDGLSSEVPERTAAHLFIADDPAIQHLRPGPDADGTQTEEQIELAA